eukprot:364527-Chlamydomonas_euryale.AAC.10
MERLLGAKGSTGGGSALAKLDGRNCGGGGEPGSDIGCDAAMSVAIEIDEGVLDDSGEDADNEDEDALVAAAVAAAVCSELDPATGERRCVCMQALRVACLETGACVVEYKPRVPASQPASPSLAAKKTVSLPWLRQHWLWIHMALAMTERWWGVGSLDCEPADLSIPDEPATRALVCELVFRPARAYMEFTGVPSVKKKWRP